MMKIKEKVKDFVASAKAKAAVAVTTVSLAVSSAVMPVLAASEAPDYNAKAMEAVTEAVGKVDFSVFFQMFALVIGAVIGVVVGCIALSKGVNFLLRKIRGINA